MNFNEWRRANPDKCLGRGVNYAWNRYMDSLAPKGPPEFTPLATRLLQRPPTLGPVICAIGTDGRVKTVTRVTSPPAPLGDTAFVESSNTNGVRNMFTLNTFESNLTKFIAAATLAALVLSVFVS